MKFSARLFSVLIVVLLMAVPFSALAQGDNPACTGLSADDCQFLVAAGDNVATATSFAIPAMSVNFTLNTGETEPTVFSVTGSGHVMLPQAGKLLVHLMFDNITVQPAQENVPSQLEVLVLDKMAYVNHEGQWYGQELKEKDLSQITSALGQTSSLGLSNLSATGLDLTGVLTNTRAEDAEAMGMNMAVYQTDVNITGLLTAVLSSPLLGEAMSAAGSDAGMSGMTAEDMQMMGMILGPMLQGTTLNIEEWFGTDDQYLHRLALNMNINVNLGMFGEADTPPITGSLNVSADLDQVNEMFDIAAPADFKPMEELDANLNGLTQGLGM